MFHRSGLIFPIFLIFLSIAASHPVTAQESPGDTVRLEDVTITVVPFREHYLEVPGGIVRISAERGEPDRAISASDLINQAPGVYLASGSYNTGRLVIRGVGSRTPYQSNRIRAYLDDVPLTSGDGFTSLEDMEVMGIGSVEILKGPSSALYGSGLGGVVRFNAPYPDKDGFSAGTSHSIGSFLTVKSTLTAGYKKSKLAMHGGFSRSYSAGFRENSTYARNSTYFNARYFGRRNELSLTLHLTGLRAGIPSSLNEDDFLNAPEKAAGNWLAVEGHEAYLRVVGGLTLETEISRRMTNRLVLFSTFRDPYETRPFNILDDRFGNVGFRETFQAEMDRAAFQAGVEFFHERVDWQIYETLEKGAQGGLLADHRERRRYVNAFLLFHLEPVDGLLIDAGMNLNLLDYRLTDQMATDSADLSGHYRYRPVLSPRLGISYRLHPGHHLYFSGGHGFSAPSLEETLLPEGTVNTELRPETGWNAEVGGRGVFLRGAVRYDATLYSVYLRDLLVTERTAEDLFTGVNAGSALNSGLELMARFRPSLATGRLFLDPEAAVGYTVSRNRFVKFMDGGTDHSGNHLPGIPSQILHTTLSGQLGPVGIDLQYRYTGRQWMDDRNEELYGGYHLVHLRMDWTIELPGSPLEIDVNGGIRNLFNTRYASMILVNAPSFGGSPPRPYYPGLPRQFFGGVAIRYGKVTTGGAPAP